MLDENINMTFWFKHFSG